MRILKLLEGLYQELKTYNEYITEVKVKEEQEKRRRELPFDHWIDKCLKEKNITDLPDNIAVVASYGFDWARKEVCKALGYDSYVDLLAAYKVGNA